MRPFCRTLAVGFGLLSFVGSGPKPPTDAAITSAYRASSVVGHSLAAPTTTSFTVVRETRVTITRTTRAKTRVLVAVKPKAAPTSPPNIAVSQPSLPAAPASCAAVVATVIWPSSWRPICTGPRVGILGLTSPDGVTTLYVRPGETSALLRIVALHEAGHAWDFTHLTPRRIAQWCAARGCSAPAFFTGGASGAGWHEPGGAEDWAASWDACHGGIYHRSYLGLPPPIASQCALQNFLVDYPGG
ncbi:MAG: hypothetical protein ACLPVY_16285 [Acidimicrobiia bacterium]